MPSRHYLSLALLDDGHGEDGEVAVDDASADGLPLALSLKVKIIESAQNYFAKLTSLRGR